MNSGRSAGFRTRAEVIFSGRKPVNNGRTPGDCPSISRVFRGTNPRKMANDGEKHTVNGANSEAEPPILMTIQNEQNDQVCNSWQDDSRSAQTGSSHEEFTCDNGVTQAGDVAKWESHANTTHCVFKAADLDEAGASHYEDEGQSEVDEDVVAE